MLVKLEEMRYVSAFKPQLQSRLCRGNRGLKRGRAGDESCASEAEGAQSSQCSEEESAGGASSPVPVRKGVGKSPATAVLGRSASAVQPTTPGLRKASRSTS